MQHRWIRITLLIVLILIGIGSASFLWFARQQSSATRVRDHHFDDTLNRMLADLADLGVAQEAYVAPNQADDPWFEVATSRLQHLRTLAATLRAPARTADAVSTVSTFRAGVEALEQVDARVRDYLRAGDDLMASDLVFSEARETLATLKANLRDMRSAETTDRDRAMAIAARQEASVVGGAAGLWLLGLLLLVPRARPREIVPQVADTVVSDAVSEPAAPAKDTPREEPGLSVNLSRAAQVCAGLARLSDAAALPSMLASAAEVLDASGLIIWLGAGDQLFAVSAHGYDPRVLARLGTIHRLADNATAQAWRRAELRTVAAGPDVNGAIVAPMIGQDGCRGVLAIEVRLGRERDEASRAVATMFAAQLAGIVSAWPAASAPVSTERASERGFASL